MGASKRLWELTRRRWDRRRRARLSVTRRVLFSAGPHVVYLFRARWCDVAVIWHRYARRVVGTVATPARLADDVGPEYWEVVLMSFLKPKMAAPKVERCPVSPPTDLLRDYPAVAEYLFAESYPDGTKRQRSTFTVMAGDSAGIKMVLNDRQEARSLWATGESLDEAMMALEVMLTSEDCPWRVDRSFRGNGKK